MIITALICHCRGAFMIGKLTSCYSDLVEFCHYSGYKLRPSSKKSPEAQTKITGAEPIGEASFSDISFCRFNDERAGEWLRNSEAGFIFICLDMETSGALKSNTSYILADHPRLAFLRFIEKFWSYEDDENQEFNIHPEAKIGKNVKIGKNCVVGANVEIGDFTVIGNNTTIIHAQIGRNCSIGSCVTIGGDGFGFEDVDGEVLTFPHIGTVKIGDDVRIGSSTCVDRASLGQTLIEDKVKIDNLVHIAHNVVVGSGSKIVAMSIIGGSTKIGKNSWIAPGVSVRDWVEIGSDVLVGMGAVVTKSVPDGKAVIGNPAKSIEKTKNRYR